MDEANTVQVARSSSTSAPSRAAPRAGKGAAYLAHRVRITPMSFRRVVVHASAAKRSTAINANVDMCMTKLFATSMTNLARKQPAHRTNAAHALHQRRQLGNHVAGVR